MSAARPGRLVMSRRAVLGSAVTMGGAGVLSGCEDAGSTGAEGATRPSPSSVDTSATQWRMPDEGDPHSRTWMAFGVQDAIWGSDQVPLICRNLASIANAISQFEPVSLLCSSSATRAAESLVGDGVDVVTGRLDDLWMRDTGPVFVTRAGKRLAGVDFNFNGWGNHQQHALDATVAAQVASNAKVPLQQTELVLEGGALEVDGQGSAIITESCVLNRNRNPGWTKKMVEAELRRLLGIVKVIWLPGIAGKDITDGHTDFYARFARPGVVVAGLDTDPSSYDYAVTRKHRKILEKATDARGERLEVHTITAPETIRPDDAEESFAAGYINFYLCNGGVIAPQFGDRAADSAARDTLHKLFPDRKIVQLDIDGIAAGGGGIHCTTQQQPMPSET